jgi:hypothetical protein
VKNIERQIHREARRLILRHETICRLAAEERKRRAKRSLTPRVTAKPKRPARWTLDSGFDPYVTRARSERIAHSIERAFRKGSYSPRPPLEKDIPKKPGSSEMRPVNIYQVADSAISKMVYENVLVKNLGSMSARAYAYRQDRSMQDALQYVMGEFAGRPRLYIAEYDFTKYFERIDHEYLRRIFRDRFLATRSERAAIDAFLRVGPMPATEYDPTAPPERTRGIPQGTSISLLLANVAAWELDRELERHGVGFARYADDTLIWSRSYAQICDAVETLHRFAEVIGVDINTRKSPGIRLLTDAPVAELSSTSTVEFLGHVLTLNSAFIKDDSVKRIKQRITRIIYGSLIWEPLKGDPDPQRFAGNVDRDYVTVLSRLRRYLYGDLSETNLRRFQSRGAPLKRFKGLLSAYPLINDEVSLKALDNWILDQLFWSLRRRADLLAKRGFDDFPTPHGVPRQQLRRHPPVIARSGDSVDMTVPSVQRIASVIRKSGERYGPAQVGRLGLPGGGHDSGSEMQPE